MDGHMEHVDVSSKVFFAVIKCIIFYFQLDYNYVLVSTDLSKKEEEQQFRAKLEQMDFIKKMEVLGSFNSSWHDNFYN